jgi:hypothetical protein
MTVKLPSLSSLAGGFLALMSALILASCGGGGAAGNPSQPGAPTVQVLPSETTIYAGVPATFQIIGGTTPYLLTSTEPTVLPVPTTVDASSFTLVGNNPGVVDVGLPAGSLPIRTVTVAVRAGNGASANVTVHVAQNFLTGYGASFSPSACPAAAATSTTTGNFACSGGETAVRFSAVLNGNLHGDEAFNLSILRGAAILVDPSTGANGATITVNSDHTGTVTAIIRAAANQPTQLGVLRIQEASTGVYMDTVFVITGGSAAATLTALPNAFTFTGATTADCGTGSGTVQVFDGVPPYTATSSNTSLVTVSPSTSSAQPGVFTISAGNRGLCGDATIVFTDSLGARTTATVTTAAGSATPVVPIQISPNPVTVGCAQTVSVSVAGGSGGSSGSTFSASTADTNLSVSITGSTLSVTRAGPAGPGSGGTVASTVTVTDGSTFSALTVNNPATCP